MADSKKTEIKFRIDVSELERQSIDPEVLAKSRMCGTNKECPSCSKTSTPPVGFKETMKAIAAGCSKREGYLLPNMSILEVVFRTLLRTNNRLLNMDGVMKALESAWQEYIHLKNRNATMIKKVLGSSNELGIISV